jgi:hypothetical protein
LRGELTEDRGSSARHKSAFALILNGEKSAGRSLEAYMSENEVAQTDQAIVVEARQDVRAPFELALIALLLGLAVEILFDGHALGINFPIWAALSAAGLLAATVFEQVKPSRTEGLLAIPVLFFSTMAAVRREELSVFLAVVFTLLCFGIWVRTFRPGRFLRFGWLDLIVAWILVPVEAMLRPWRTAAAAWRRAVGESGARKRGWALLRGVLLALPVLAIFTALLAAADLVFGDLVENILKWLNIELLLEWFGRSLVILLSGLFSLGALVAALREREPDPLLGEEKPLIKRFVGFTETSIVLGAVDLLFLFFVLVQFRYFFGGQANISAAGYTYSEYARRGFGELVTVAVLALGLIMALGYYGKREETGQERWFNGLSTALVALLGVMLLSAFLRLQLYETAYGFTRLRTYTHFFIFWLGLGLVVFLVLLYRRELRRFAPAVFLGSMGFAATLNLINIDGYIAQRNIQRFMGGQAFETAEGRSYPEVDLGYLLSLSADVMPTVAGFAQQAPQELRYELLGEIACRVQNGWSNYNRDSWPSYHFSRARADRILADLEDELAQYEVEWDNENYRNIATGPQGPVECRGYYGYNW